MKGLGKLLGMFMQIMEIMFVVLALVAVFFTVSNFNIAIEFAKGTRGTVLATQAVLSAPCLTVLAPDGYAVRGLFDQAKLNAEATADANPTCLISPNSTLFEFDLGGTESESSVIRIGKKNVEYKQSVQYPAALRKTDGTIIPIVLTTHIGV